LSKVTSQHTVMQTNYVSMYSWDHAKSKYYHLVEVYHNWDKFIGNKQIHSFTY